MSTLDGLTAAAANLRGVFCDIDDTLTHQGALVPEAYAGLVELAQAGLRVVPVTGRPAGYAAVLAALWPACAVVAENGAVAYVRRSTGTSHPGLDATYWDDDAARAAHRPRLDTLRHLLLARFPFARVADDQWLRVCDLAFDIGERQKLDAAQVAALRAAIEAAGARCLTSTVHAHAYFGDHDKARMLVRLARALWSEDLDGADRERYLFVGDSPNDAAGFAHFPLSAGPSNAAKWNMQPGPVYVATEPGGHGFAQIARAVLDGISKPH